MRGYVDTSWGQLHYSVSGSGDKTIALFHENPLNHASYQHLIPALAGSMRVFAFDTPGNGESDPPPAITTIEEYSARFREAIDALSIDRLAVLGTHTGAQIAVQLAAEELRDRVDGVVLMGLPYYEEEVRLARVPAKVPPFRDDGQHLIEGFMRPPREYHPEVLSRMVAAVSERPDYAFWAYHSVYKYLPGEKLPDITAPVLFLTASIDILHSGDVKGAGEVKDGRLIEIPTERVPLYWTQPTRVAEEVISFLDGR